MILSLKKSEASTLFVSVLKQQTSQAGTQHRLLVGETPADQDQWRDSEDVMNLFFNLDYNTDNKNSNIASATLRLYRLPQNITNRSDSAKDDCKNNEGGEEERLLRVSVYWYAKLQKKRRGRLFERSPSCECLKHRVVVFMLQLSVDCPIAKWYPNHRAGWN